MHRQRIAIVYNPAAGRLRGKGRARLDQSAAVLRAAGHEVDLLASPGPNCAGAIAREASENGHTLILAAGGDGTINETVNGLVGSPVTFGILPSGTANCLAAEIGLSTDPQKAAHQLLEALPARIAVGAVDRANAPRRHFVLMTGAGLDARIVSNLDLDLKRKFGKLAYWHGGFRELAAPPDNFQVTVDGETFSTSFILATRIRNYGGDFEIARRVRLTDPDFEVVTFRCSHWSGYFRFIAGVVTNRLEKVEGVRIARARAVSVVGPAMLQSDGEAMGSAPATISIVPDALTLLLPRNYASVSQNG